MKRVITALLFAAGAAKAGPVLDQIRASHTLSCGVVTEENDETTDDTHGDLSAFGREICRAIAAAVLSPQGKIELRRFPSEQTAFQALQQSKIAVFIGATPSADLARRYDVSFLAPVFYDAQGILAHNGAGIGGLSELTGKRVCFIDQTDAARVFIDAAARAGVHASPFPFEEVGEMEAALVDGHCDAETFDISKLAGDRALFHARKNDFTILPDRLTLDPLAPVIRANDPEWGRIVDWVGYALVQAELEGLTQANIGQVQQGTLAAQDLAGQRPWAEWGLGLNNNWSRWAIETVGSYGEIFDRTVGGQSPLRLERGLNRPYSQGGLLWSPPWR